VEDFTSHFEKTIQAFANERLPELADQLQLFAERTGRSHRRSAQKIEKIDRLCVGKRNKRPGGKIFGKLRRYLAICGLFGQAFVVEQFLERPESFIAVGGPEQQQLFQSGGTVRRSIGFASQPLRRRLHALHHTDAGKLLDKGEEHGVQRLRADLGGKPVQRAGHDLGIELFAVARNQHVAGLVDQAHCVQRASMDGQFGILFDIAHLVHAMSELAASGHIGKNHVSRIGKEGFRELVAFTRIPRNVKFHHWQPNTPEFPI
jgi:hypothetical protein